MTDAELDAIEARANAASPGPWRAKFGKGAHEVYENTDRGRTIALCPNEPVRPFTLEEEQANARLMAAARSDIPALVAEVRRLRFWLDRIATHRHLNPETNRHDLIDSSTKYLEGVVSGHLCAAAMAQHALNGAADEAQARAALGEK